MSDVTFPVVHLNGTAKEDLIGNLSQVWDALEEARNKMKQAVPNGRDYYPAPGRLTEAMRQHRERLLAIDAIQNSIQSEIDAIEDQQ